MRAHRFTLYLAAGCLLSTVYSACIGTDYIEDAVEPELRITTQVEALGVGDSFQLEASYFNQVGLPEEVSVGWESSAPELVEVSPLGLVRARAAGTAVLRASFVGEMFQASDSLELTVDSVGAPTTMPTRGGRLATQSSYELTGTFSLDRSEDETGITIRLAADYVADDGLPGLYLYLTNNPSSVAGAYEIGAVTVFEGAHEYEVADVDVDQYAYLLYYCKPFSVRVGSGEIR